MKKVCKLFVLVTMAMGSLALLGCQKEEKPAAEGAVEKAVQAPAAAPTAAQPAAQVPKDHPAH